MKTILKKVNWKLRSALLCALLIGAYAAVSTLYAQYNIGTSTVSVVATPQQITSGTLSGTAVANVGNLRTGLFICQFSGTGQAVVTVTQSGSSGGTFTAVPASAILTGTSASFTLTGTGVTTIPVTLTALEADVSLKIVPTGTCNVSAELLSVPQNH